ncbi:hypothetical protein [Parasphingorhabdus sp.]|jgi:hypothetical protein|uniref:hypothetical protein n=1 Tax=Parasphingorhabdus sp. TaxID=2709688 RepID=UPI0030AF6608|nr:hypothetical protein [Sphingomonadales bacterium]
MSDPAHVWLIDSKSALKRRVRLEVIGKAFTLYEQQWRSETFFFGDLIYRGKQGGSHVFGLEDGIKARPVWRLGVKGEIPTELSALFPRRKPPLLSNAGMAIIAFLCLAIVYFAVT